MSFNYMAERKYETRSVNTAYMTAYKREQQLSNISNVLKFLINCIENKWAGIGVAREEDCTGSVSMYYSQWWWKSP